MSLDYKALIIKAVFIKSGFLIKINIAPYGSDPIIYYVDTAFTRITNARTLDRTPRVGT